MFYLAFLVSVRCNILGLCWKQKTAKYISGTVEQETQNSILLFLEVFIAERNSADRLQLSVTQFLLVGVIFSDTADKREGDIQMWSLNVSSGAQSALKLGMILL